MFFFANVECLLRKLPKVIPKRFFSNVKKLTKNIYCLLLQNLSTRNVNKIQQQNYLSYDSRFRFSFPIVEIQIRKGIKSKSTINIARKKYA